MVTPVSSAEYLKEIEGARRDLRALISSKQCAPDMLHLAWHDACTYDAKTNTGGPNGSIRRKEELQHGYNKSLEGAVNLCEPVKQRHPRISYADLYQLAGIVAIEVTGGPTIDFVAGRKDANKSPKEGRVPTDKQDAEGLRQAFFRMGLSDKDIVAFCGGNILLGGTEPLKFDNSYFVELAKGESEGSIKVPTHKALVQDPVFWGYVQMYAKDEDAFFKDYADMHKKLSELGLSVPFRCNKTLAKRLIGVALACCMVLFSYFYEIHRRVG